MQNCNVERTGHQAIGNWITDNAKLEHKKGVMRTHLSDMTILQYFIGEVAAEQNNVILQLYG